MCAFVQNCAVSRQQGGLMVFALVICVCLISVVENVNEDVWFGEELERLNSKNVDGVWFSVNISHVLELKYIKNHDIESSKRVEALSMPTVVAEGANSNEKMFNVNSGQKIKISLYVYNGKKFYAKQPLEESLDEYDITLACEKGDLEKKSNLVAWSDEGVKSNPEFIGLICKHIRYLRIAYDLVEYLPVSMYTETITYNNGFKEIKQENLIQASVEDVEKKILESKIKTCDAFGYLDSIQEKPYCENVYCNSANEGICKRLNNYYSIIKDEVQSEYIKRLSISTNPHKKYTENIYTNEFYPVIRSFLKFRILLSDCIKSISIEKGRIVSDKMKITDENRNIFCFGSEDSCTYNYKRGIIDSDSCSYQENKGAEEYDDCHDIEYVFWCNGKQLEIRTLGNDE